jgi:hypothetical protein
VGRTTHGEASGGRATCVYFIMAFGSRWLRDKNHLENLGDSGGMEDSDIMSEPVETRVVLDG